MKLIFITILALFVAAAVGGLWGKYYDTQTSQSEHDYQENIDAQRVLRELKADSRMNP